MAQQFVFSFKTRKKTFNSRRRLRFILNWFWKINFFFAELISFESFLSWGGFGALWRWRNGRHVTNLVRMKKLFLHYISCSVPSFIHLMRLSSTGHRSDEIWALGVMLTCIFEGFVDRVEKFRLQRPELYTHTPFPTPQLTRLRRSGQRPILVL